MNRRKLLTLAAAAAVVGCGGSVSNWDEISIPLPAVLRTDLNYCYYLSLPGQMLSTADHTNLLWHGQFYSSDALENEVRGYTHKIVLDCAPQLFIKPAKGGSIVSPAAEVQLRHYFNDLQVRGLLSRVAYLVPMDEPNLFCASEYDLLSALSTMKKVAAEFAELKDVQYMCIYGSKAKNLFGLHEFDVVGIDNYKQRSLILTEGAHASLMQQIAPHQKVMVIPGAAYYQDPAAFVAYAHTEPKCWGVVPFIWCHVAASADPEGWKGLSMQTEAEQERYRQAGRLTLGMR